MTLEDLEPRCRLLLEHLQRARGEWLLLGHVRTLCSRHVYLRAGFLGQWELYERQQDGSFKLGPEHDAVRLFDRDGDFPASVRAHPELAPEPIVEPFASRVAALDASAAEHFAALESGSTTFLDTQLSGTIGRFDERFWLLKDAGDAIWKVRREAVARRLWEALFAGRESINDDVASWLETVRALVDPPKLLTRVLSRGASVITDREPFQKIYRRADGQLVMLVPSGEIVPDYYPGDGYTCDPADGKEYIEKPCSEEELREAVFSREVHIVEASVPEETGGRAVW
jgi:hypothetical protein